MTNDWFIAVEGGLASLALRCCRLVTGRGQFRACLALHPAIYPSTPYLYTSQAISAHVVATANASAIPIANVSIPSEPRNKNLKLLSGKSFR